jgi:uncharacterized protein
MLQRVTRVRPARWLLAAVLGAAPLHAEEVSWLYDVQVPVADQSASARLEAGGRALTQVLSRITGLASVPTSEPVSRALATPDRYYSQFGFERAPDGDGLMLRVQFVPAAVLDLVRAAELPVWRSSRPRVIAWVAVEDTTGERQILSAASEQALADGVLGRARERGLPLQLPLLDLEDQLAVDPAAVWGRLSQSLLPASERYDADIVLVGRVQQRGEDAWSSSWEFWVDGDILHLDGEGPDAETLGRAAADLVADELARRYAVLGGSLGRLDMAVSALQGARDYAQLLRYLGDLEFVDELLVSRVEGDRVYLSLLTSAEPDQLLELFRLDQRLFSNSLDDAGDVTLDLVWQRR